jgi:hypothetical protein
MAPTRATHEPSTNPHHPRIDQGDVLMEVRIGVQHAARELVIESADSQDDVTAAVSAALTGDSGLLQLNDESGRRVVVPSDKLAYVEIGEPESRRVGFGAL